MTQARKPAGSAGGTGGQFDRDPKAGTGDLPGLPPAGLAGADLEGLDASGRSLGGARLDGSDVVHARFDRADLKGASLQGAYISDSTFDGADLSDANLSASRLEGVSFRGADLRNARCGLYPDVDPNDPDSAEYDARENLYYRRYVPPYASGVVDFSGADLTGADLTGLDPGEAYILVSPDTRVDGLTVNSQTLGRMADTVTGRPLSDREAARRGIRVAPGLGPREVRRYLDDDDEE